MILKFGVKTRARNFGVKTRLLRMSVWKMLINVTDTPSRDSERAESPRMKFALETRGENTCDCVEATKPIALRCIEMRITCYGHTFTGQHYRS